MALTPRNQKIALKIFAAMPFITAGVGIALFLITHDINALQLLWLAALFFISNMTTLRRAKAAQAAQGAVANEA